MDLMKLYKVLELVPVPRRIGYAFHIGIANQNARNATIIIDLGVLYEGFSRMILDSHIKMARSNWQTLRVANFQQSCTGWQNPIHTASSIVQQF